MTTDEEARTALAAWDKAANRGTPHWRTAAKVAEALREVLSSRDEFTPHENLCGCGATGNGDCRVTDDELRESAAELRVELAEVTHQRDRLHALARRMRKVGYSPTVKDSLTVAAPDHQAEAPSDEALWDLANDLLDAWNIEDTNPPSLIEDFRDRFVARFGALAARPVVDDAAVEAFCDQCGGPYDGWLTQYGGHWDTCPNRVPTASTDRCPDHPCTCPDPTERQKNR